MKEPEKSFYPFAFQRKLIQDAVFQKKIVNLYDRTGFKKWRDK